MTNPRDDASDTTDTETVYESMEPLEPYTTGELASLLDAPRRLVRTLLDALAGDEKIRKKEPEPDRTIWVREPPKHECPQCGRQFEVKYFHPIFQAVQYCPKCGTQLRRQG
jgi:hypothetical protein